MIEDGKIVAVGSRSRWIAPGKLTDNYGFAGWVEAHHDDLLKLGEGTHFGEWYGNGIQRNYGLAEKRFALFNTARWSAPFIARTLGHDADIPRCVEVVPVLYNGPFTATCIADAMAELKANGSYAVPGWMDPEGVVGFLPGARMMLKETYEFSEGKWKGEAA